VTSGSLTGIEPGAQTSQARTTRHVFIKFLKGSDVSFLSGRNRSDYPVRQLGSVVTGIAVTNLVVHLSFEVKVNIAFPGKLLAADKLKVGRTGTFH